MTTKKQIITEKTELQRNVSASKFKWNQGVKFGKQEQKKEELEFLRKAEDLGFFDRDCLCEICVFVKQRIKQLEGIKRK